MPAPVDLRSSEKPELICVVYASSAVELFSPGALLDLLRLAEEKNGRLGLSGMLLYKDGCFMQCLGGPDTVVSDLYSTIERDARHRGIISLMNYRIPQRQFPNWSMGFTNLEGLKPSDGDGYNDFLNQPLTSALFREDPSRAERLLLSFRKHM